MYYFIYPNKDSYIYELNTNSEKNFGGDDNLSDGFLIPIKEIIR